MEISAQQIAELLNGTVEGDGTTKVNNISKIEEGAPHTLTFLANPKYTHFIYETKASIALVNKNFIAEKELKKTLTLIRVDNAYEAFAKLLELYQQMKQNKQGIEQPNYINPNAKIGKNCYIAAFAYIDENVILGDDVKVYPHAYIGSGVVVGNNSTIHSGVKIYSDCKIGANCIIHAGTVVGADGFGFAPNQAGQAFAKVPQIGNVIIEDNVEIGANTCIDRATIGSTLLKKGVKLDNLVQIAHNVEIGENTVIAGQTGVAGSSKVGTNCMIGAQVGVVGHLKIANGTKIAGQSGIASDILNENEIHQGSPSFKVSDYRRSYVLFRSLPNIEDRLRKLEKNIFQK
ncbi:MAG: UDP-3-O-(3-hydroxymyristoyl)glucosamine N-acyltransferase [Bacteroidetes bacterium]|nr:UDP-3-O-(3-hydroxymyristoyl)glucosamine N-acyltransferase [Bacteroidota bacterium]